MTRKSYQKHRKKRIANARVSNARYFEKYKHDPQFRALRSVRNKIGTIRKRFKRGKETPSGRKPRLGSSTLELVGCTLEEYIQYLEEKFKPNMSWKNYGEWEIDHIKEISAFDLTDASQIKEAMHYTNTQPLWARENKRKSYKQTLRHKRGEKTPSIYASVYYYRLGECLEPHSLVKVKRTWLEAAVRLKKEQEFHKREWVAKYNNSEEGKKKRRVANKKWRSKNKEKAAEYGREYYQKNKKKLAEKAKKYYLKKKEENGKKSRRPPQS